MELFPLFGFLEIKPLFVILHLVGVVVGAGAAVFSAAMFTKVMYDGMVTEKEYEFLELGSMVVGAGLVLIVASGIGLFSLDPERYLASSKFLIKMTVIGVLVVNGTLIHTLHMPIVKKHIGKRLAALAGFRTRSALMYAGGAVSMVSWMSALALGSLAAIPFPYTTLLTVYAVLLIVGIGAALFMQRITFSRNPET